MRAVALLLSLISALPAVADEPVSVDTRLRTVVMGIAPRRGIEDKSLTSALSDVVLGAYAGDRNRVVIGPGDIQRALEWEASKQEAGCNDNTCLAEVGAALDAARIVSGTLDAIGDVYLLSLSEMDARSLEPVGRVQQQVEKNEVALLDTTRKLAEELLEKAKAAPAAVAAAMLTGQSGSIEIETDPRDVTIVVGNGEMGKTPTRLENINAGRHTLRLIRTDYEPVEIDVPVYAGGTTRVRAELRLMRSIAETNLQVRQTRWRDDDEWNQIIGWTKIGGGAVVGLVGLGVMAGVNATQPVANVVPGDGAVGGVIAGGVLAGVGAGLGVWGALDLLNPPPAPIPDWELERKVTVTPPADKGEVEVRLLQEGVGPPPRQ